MQAPRLSAESACDRHPVPDGHLWPALGAGRTAARPRCRVLPDRRPHSPCLCRARNSGARADAHTRAWMCL